MSQVIDQTGTVLGQGDPWERHLRIVDLRNQAEDTFLDLGRELYFFQQQEGYVVLGHPSFESYLADPEVDIGRRTAFMLKAIYETYVLGLCCEPAALLPCGYSKLDIMRSFMTQENVMEWIGTAAALSRSDLKKELGEAFPPEIPQEPPEVCPTCGRPWPKRGRKRKYGEGEGRFWETIQDFSGEAEEAGSEEPEGAGGVDWPQEVW